MKDGVDNYQKKISCGKLLRVVLVAAYCILSLTGCGVLKKSVPKNWYDSTVKFYQEGFSDNWKNVGSDFIVPDCYTNGKYKYGYLLKDLNNDGADELLIGIISDSGETKFTDVYIYHSDMGPLRIFSADDEYSIYLCDSSVIRLDKWYGSETQIDYMVYNPEGDTFINVDGGSMPRHYELTPF